MCEHVSYRWFHARAVFAKTGVCCGIGGTDNFCLQQRVQLVLMLLQFTTLLGNLVLCSLKGLHGLHLFVQGLAQSLFTASDDALNSCQLFAERPLICQCSSPSENLLLKSFDICAASTAAVLAFFATSMRLLLPLPFPDAPWPVFPPCGHTACETTSFLLGNVHKPMLLAIRMGHTRSSDVNVIRSAKCNNRKGNKLFDPDVIPP